MRKRPMESTINGQVTDHSYARRVLASVRPLDGRRYDGRAMRRLSVDGDRGRAWLRRIAGLAATAWLGFVACTHPPEAAPNPKPAAVTVVAVAQRPVPVYGQYVGQTEAVQTVEIRARVEGFVNQQAVPDGADVKAGDVLFVIDPRQYEAALLSAKGQLAQAQANLTQAREQVQLLAAQAQLTQARANLNQARQLLALRQAEAQLEDKKAVLSKAQQDLARLRPLAQKQAVAQQDLDNAIAAERSAAANVDAAEAVVKDTALNQKTAIEQAEAGVQVADVQVRNVALQTRVGIETAQAAVEQAKAAVAQAELNLGYTTIRSPVTGRMGRAEVRVGSFVGKGEATLLATVSTLDPMYVTFSVSEREALQVWRRRPADMPARPGPSGITITLPDDTVYPHDGRLDFVDRAVDPRTGTLALRATFPNPVRLLRPGQYVRLRILLDERAGALLVPQAAIQESQGSASLFVVGSDQTVQARTVRMGARFGTLWVVEDGVKLGEQVVIKGLQQVRDGMRVEPTVEAIPAAPQGAAQRPDGRRPTAGR